MVVMVVKKNHRPKRVCFSPVHPAAIAAAVDLAGGSNSKTAAAPALLFRILTFLFSSIFPAPVEPLRSAFSPSTSHN